MQKSSLRNGIFASLIAGLLIAGILPVMADDGTNTTANIGGTIIVMSFPQGAAVTLNGEYRGNAPVRLEHIPAGNYEVGVSKAGYNNDSVPVELFDGSTREIGFTLVSLSQVTASPGTGSIAISSSPGGASVSIDGNYAGTTRVDGYAFSVNDVPAGSHVVTVELAGYPVYTSTVTVIKNQVVKVSAVFEVKTAAVTGTPAATTNRPEQTPLVPFVAAAAAGIAGLLVASRRS